jgi:hypothetical protein
MKKICPSCGEERDIEKDFSWKNKKKDVRQRWCKLHSYLVPFHHVLWHSNPSYGNIPLAVKILTFCHI